MGEEEKIDLEEKRGGKKGFPILLILIVAVLSAGITFAVVKFVLTPKPPAQAEVKKEDGKKVEDKTKKETKTDEKVDEGNANGENVDLAEGDTAEASRGILSLNEFIVNLNDPIGRRYIKVTIKLELSKKEYEDKIRSDELLIPQIRDVIFLIISSKSYDDLRTVSGKLTLKQEIISKVNEVLNKKFGEDVVTNCFFTDFVIQ